MKPSIKAIIFDIDGVLVPGDKWHKEAFIRVLKKYKISISDDFYNNKLGSLPTISKLHILEETHNFNPKFIEEANSQKQKITKRILRERTKKSSRLIKLFRKLKSMQYRLACCSNSRTKTVDYVLKRLGLMGEIEFYLTGAEFNPKPDPSMLKEAINKFNLKPFEVLILEDSKEGIKAVKKSNANLLTIRNPKETNLKNIINSIKKLK